MSKKKNTTAEPLDVGFAAFLPGSKALVLEFDSKLLTVDGAYPTVPVTVKEDPKAPGAKQMPGSVSFVQWGDGDSLPLDILSKVYKNVTVGANVEFNTRLGAGDGVRVYKRVRQEGGEIKLIEQLESEQPAVYQWLTDNNYVRCLQEIMADISVFSEAVVELSLSAEKKLVRCEHKEMTYSRLSETNSDGKIEWHGYSAGWSKKNLEDIVVTPYLGRRAPMRELKQRIGMLMGDDKETADSGFRRFILPISAPVPGRFYYNKPYWWSIFESGWYDFACAIPEFKRAMIQNQAVLKYHVHIEQTFWKRYYDQKGITDAKDKRSARQAYLAKLDDFLSGHKNSGRSVVSEFNYDLNKGIERNDIIIKLIDTTKAGGEYINDIEYVNNMICYAMGVHASLIGANPGKGSNISGSEARELFTIKQAMMKFVRDLSMLPLQIAKELNGWDKDLVFAIPNVMLTTLDKNTGAIKQIGNQEV